MRILGTLTILLYCVIGYSEINYGVETSNKIDMDVLSIIESSSNPKAVNKKSGAVGLYQITPLCLRDYNKAMQKCYTMQDMLEGDKNYIVAAWYIQYAIPKYLKYYDIPPNESAILAAYNAGIKRLVNYTFGKVKLPQETINYIAKYKTLKGVNNGG